MRDGEEHVKPSDDPVPYVWAGERPAFDEAQWRALVEEELTPRERWVRAGLLLALMAVGVAYRLVVMGGFGRTGLMFLGLPALLAVLLVLLPKSKTTTGAIVKGITLLVLVVAPLLGEGYLCILIASPLFYAVGIVVGLIADAMRDRKRTLGCVAVLVLPLCLEGTAWQMPRGQVVETTRVVDASAADVEQALSGPMQIERALPRFLRIGFPRPVTAWGGGLRAGDVRGLHFTGAEGTPPGDLLLRVADSKPGYVRMEVVSDKSKVTEWLWWRDTEVMWRAVDAGHTAVTARVHFDRGLDPAWYFTAWERFAVKEAAGYLIAANAVPGGR